MKNMYRSPKRVRLSQPYKPLDIADDQLDKSPQEELFSGYSTIPYTRSSEWGSEELATAKALAQTEVTTENEQFIRTFHPAFFDTEHVRVDILYWRDNSRAWVINSTNCFVPYTHAGGLEIHVVPNPKAYRYPCLVHIDIRPDLFEKYPNPRRILNNDDLEKLRAMYPTSCGVRLWLGATIEVLYPTEAELRKDVMRYAPLSMGNGKVEFGVLSCRPCRGASVPRGHPVASAPTAPQSSIGLRLRMPDGQSAITTVTHGFVRDPSSDGLIRRSIGFLSAIKSMLTNFHSPGRIEFDQPFVRPSDTPTTNTSLGKEAWFVDSNRRVGIIKATFDAPSDYCRYPAGYSHDLSLIFAASDNEADQLPSVDSPAGLPEIREWAQVTDALGGKPLFVTSTISFSDKVKTTHGQILDRATNAALRGSVRKAMAEGVQYLWDTELLDQSVSLLWRAVPEPRELAVAKDEHHRKQLRRLSRSVQGYSGSVLCLGRPTDATAKALVFQNFELQTPITIGEEEPYEDEVFVKGGFLLPRFVYEKCTLEHSSTCSIGNAVKDFSSVPRMRKSTDSDSGKRSFSELV